MTVREEVRERIEQDPELIRLRKKIESGKATYADTAAYSNRAGKLLGEVFSHRLPEIPLEEREPRCVELLHDRYIDINAAVDTAQRFMDEALGIHIAPQHAQFDSERGHQIGSSLRDLSKPVETLQRRSRAATETATKAMHDDRMKAESKFRHRAGLDCRITRVAVNGCCPWCSKVAGRYRYGEEPDDIYRRHDNCDCTVTFENGRKRQDVWSKREWEAPEPGAGAGDAVVLTEEQAEALQAKHGLTKLDESSTIRERSRKARNSGDLQPFGSRANTGSDLFSNEAIQNLRDREKEISDGRTETAVLFSPTGIELLHKPGDVSRVTFSSDELKMMKGGILTHNHPNGTPFSPDDISFMLKHGLSEMRVSIPNGTYVLQRTKRTIHQTPSLEDVTDVFYDAYGEAGKKLELVSAQEGWRMPVYLRRVDEETIKIISQRYGLNFRLEVNSDV